MAVCLIFLACEFGSAQSGKVKPSAKAAEVKAEVNAPLLTRRTVRREARRFGYGSALTINGAPVGNITVEVWSRNEVEVEAELEMRATSEEDLDVLASVNNVVFDAVSPNNLQVFTVGTHDRKYLKRTAKNFPKRLLNAAWRADYKVKVPAFVDLEINAGQGDINISQTEGAARINLVEGTLNLALQGGDVVATVATGAITLTPVQRSWRGRGVDLRVGTGRMTLALPPDFNADINAEVLRTGSIEATAQGLTAQDDTSPASSSVFTITTDGKRVEKPTNPTATSNVNRTLRARSGAGGVSFALVVGDGTLRIIRQDK